MNELLHLHQHTVFLRREAISAGYTDADLLRHVRSGLLAKPRYGAYVDAGVWAAADPIERYRIRCHVVALLHGDSVMLSHVSAAATHRLALHAPDLSRVHVTRLDGRSGRVEAGVHHHTPAWRDDQVVRHGEILVADELTAALGAATQTSVEQGLVIIDSFLARRPEDVTLLHAAYRAMSGHPNARRLQLVVRLARPGAHSAFESRCRYTMWRQHLPEPELQWHVYDGDGVLVGITDFAWPDHQLLGEADGRLKHGRLLGPNPTPAQISAALVAEKEREDLLREITGFGMIRYVWEGLAVPERFGRRTRAMLDRYSGLVLPTAL